MSFWESSSHGLTGDQNRETFDISHLTFDSCHLELVMCRLMTNDAPARVLEPGAVATGQRLARAVSEPGAVATG